MEGDHSRANDGERCPAVDATIKVFEQLRRAERPPAPRPPPWYDAKATAIHRKHLIAELKSADERLHAITSGRLPLGWADYDGQRTAIKAIFVDLVRHEMKFCRQHNVEQHFWRILYYNFIESIRRLMAASDKSSDVYRCCCVASEHLIDDGLRHFDGLLEATARAYDFRLDDFLGANGGRSLRGLKYVSLALVAAQKMCMYVGDLLRYRELINQTAHFDAAMDWYVKAYQLIPSNGMPSNQMAILSLYNKRKFDAIFYHMRSLSASNPIKSAKESLVILFDELRKKWQSLEAQRDRRTDSRRPRSEEHFKREIWVHPRDGQLNYRTVFVGGDGSEPADPADLYKKFILHFSHVHGVLFTRVACETLEQCTRQSLQQLRELLGHRAAAIFAGHKMTQMLVLNVFAVDNCSRDESPLLLPAVAFLFTFVAVVLSKIQDDLAELISSGPSEAHKRIDQFQLAENVDTSLTVLSLWSKWAQTKRSVWSTPPTLRAIHQSGAPFGLCIWSELAKAATALAAFDFTASDFITVCPNDVHAKDGLVKFRLPEELITLGTPYLLHANNLFCSGAADARSACSFVRLRNVYEFCAEELAEGERPLLRRANGGKFVASDVCDAQNEPFRSANNEPPSTSSNASAPSERHSSDSHDSHGGSDEEAAAQRPSRVQADTMPHSSSDEIQKLLQRKTELEQSHKMHEQMNRFTQEILRQDNADVVCIEIRPKYLVPDTNCYIDFLDEIKQLVGMYPAYHVIVPLVVLNELEGLAKGDASGTRRADTPVQAQRALVLLKSSGNAVKCATTKGSFLNSMTFTRETDASPVNQHLNNDDKILLTVANLTEAHSKRAVSPADAATPTNLQRKVVLLTNDRNLKLKAIAQNIPVRELIDFVKWSGIGK